MRIIFSVSPVLKLALKPGFTLALVLSLISGVFSLEVSSAEISAVAKKHLYAGYYSREGNNEKMAKVSGNNQYLRFYPEKRVIRLYIPYSKTASSDTINRVFNQVKKETTGSAYIKGKFGVMDEPIIAYLDFFHWVNDQVMYDCGKPKPCRVTFNDHSMTVIKPGLVLEHKIHYSLVSD